jgi:hypothetical protein
MSDEIRAILRDQAGKASIQRLWKHTVSIVNGVRISGTDPITKRRADGEQFGSGCAALWGKQHLILTAEHVLQGAEVSDLRVFSYPGAFQYRPAADLRKEDVVDAVPLRADNAVIHRCGWDDLALIVVEPDDIGENVEFFDLGNDWIDPAEGEPVHCFGFPSDSHVPWESFMVGNKEERTVAVYPGTFDGIVTYSPKFLSRKFDPERHYLVPFTQVNEGKHPEGYSGGGAWWESDQPDLIWRPNYKFAGICTSCYQDGAFEQVVKASAVRRFVEEVLGQL